MSAHHSPTAAGDWAIDASIVHAADVIANAVNWDGCAQQLVPPLSETAWDSIDIPESALPELVERAHQQYLDAARLLLS